MRNGWLVALAAVLFATWIFYVALSSAPPGPPTGVDHNAQEAERACRLALRDSIPDPIFPFSATPTYLGEGRYQLSGTVDARGDGDGLRRNYECWIRFVEVGSYRADSIQLWQSH